MLYENNVTISHCNPSRSPLPSFCCVSSHDIIIYQIQNGFGTSYILPTYAAKRLRYFPSRLRVVFFYVYIFIIFCCCCCCCCPAYKMLSSAGLSVRRSHALKSPTQHGNFRIRSDHRHSFRSKKFGKIKNVYTV